MSFLRFILVWFIIGCISNVVRSSSSAVGKPAGKQVYQNQKGMEHFVVFHPNQITKSEASHPSEAQLLAFDEAGDLEFQDEESAGADGDPASESSDPIPSGDVGSNGGGEASASDNDGGDAGQGEAGQYRRGETVDVDENKLKGLEVKCPPGIPGLKPGATCYRDPGSGAIMVPEDDHLDGGSGEGTGGGDGESSGGGDGAGDDQEQVERRKSKSGKKATRKIKPRTRRPIKRGRPTKRGRRSSYRAQRRGIRRNGF